MRNGEEAPASNNVETAKRDQLYVLREQQSAAMNQMFEQTADGAVFDALSSVQLSGMIKRLHEHFAEFKKAHQSYRAITILASDEVYHDAGKLYMGAISKMEIRLEGLGGQEQISLRPDPPTTHSSITHQQMIIQVVAPRRPMIGTFDGSPAAWLAFRDLFTVEVHEKDFAPVTKLKYLKEALIGDASDVLSSWLTLGCSYEPAWQTVKEAFDDAYYVADAMIAELFSIPKHETESCQSLRDLVNSGRGKVRQLDAYYDPASLRELLLIHIFTRQSPWAINVAWRQHQISLGVKHLPTFEEYLKFLDARAYSLWSVKVASTWTRQSSSSTFKREAGSPWDERRSKPYKKSRPYGKQRRKEGRGKSSALRRCIMRGCDEIHYLGQCAMFRKLNLTQRLEQAINYRLCGNCLVPGHFAAQCRRQGCRRCPEAGVKHHYQLCPKQVEASYRSVTTSARTAHHNDDPIN